VSAVAVNMAEEKLCVAVIAGAHGVRGDVRIKSFTADPKGLAGYGPLTDKSGERTFLIKPLGIAKGLLRAHIKGVDDRNAAEALAGVELYIERSRLPEPEEDEFYHSDLIGLRAELEDGTEYGTVRALHDFGAGDVIEIALSAGGTVVLPFTRTVVPSIDLDAGFVVIAPPEEVEAKASDEDEG
jgi:16S rRNA processing protein RimM